MKEDIAIIGMDCIFPGAPDIQTYWQNIISKVNSITDPPKEAWDSDTHYDPDSLENDRVYCRRGGYIGPLAHFDPLDYGIMPTAVEGSEPDQWLALKVAHNALHDAGYQNRPPEGKKTAVILGKGNYLNRGNLSVVQNSVVVDQTLEILKTLHPEYTSDDLAAIRKELKQCLPTFNAETVSGLIPNIIASRIANRLDLMGPCYTVDGACASSLLAMDIAVRELLEKKIDLALVGGSQVTTPVGVFGVFCQLNALSRKEQIRPFDKDADGTILGEGIGMIILKRRSDAERDGNRIYALIKGVGTSSDGRGVGVLAPRIEGGVLAMQRAYERGGISPATIGLIEAHGTGTLAGDINEMHALKQVFGPRNNNLPWCAVGSVKSMIGHAMPAAGIAGIIKTALSLYHKVLPPTLNVDQPNPKLELEKSPFYINTETRPWFHDSLETPRRAGVNAFGFGGINAHAILEEYRGKSKPNATFHHRLWDTEVFILQGKSRDELITQGKQLQDYLLKHPQTELKDLAHTLNTLSNETTYRLTIVASSLKELETKLARAIKQLTNQACRQIKDVQGIYFFEQPLKKDGKLAFLFPGEGSQYINMLSDLCIHFPEIRQCFDKIDRIFSGSNRDYLPSDFIFPRPVFSEGERKAAEERLWKMDGAIEAVLTANEALFKLLSHLEIKPDVILGHSTGEYSAMSASGIFNITDGSDHGQRALELNQSYRQKAAGDGIPHARLVAVGADIAKVAALIDRVDDELYIAMDNCPHQTVIAGAEAGIQKAVAEMNRQGLIYQILPFDRPYHTPLFKAYAESLHQFFERWPVSSPTIPHYSCTTIAPFSTNPDEISKLAVEHWVRPVEFRKTIEKMYKDGVRIFVEVGPKSNLTAFVDDILRGREYMAVPTNTERRSGITQINHLVGILAAHGVPINTDYLYRRRAPRKIFLDQHPDKKEKAEKPKTKKKIATGWPPMRISNETAKRLNSRVSAKENDSTLSSNDSLEVKEGLSNITPPFSDDSVLSRSLHEIDAHRQSEAEHVPASEVMSNYLKTMEHFLETQQQIMQTFLSTAVEEGQDDGREKTSKVKVDSPLPSPEKADDHPLTLKQDLIEIVSEKTGYPKEMLDLNLDMEADLGIDSIKRTEIMGVLNERYGGKLGQEMDQVSALKTLKQVVDFLEGHLEGVVSPTLEPTKVINKSEGEEKKAAFSESAEAKPFPFIGKITSLVPGQKLEALRRISLDEDLYLKDHTIGGKISCMDNTLRPLAVMPLTLSMEILAEAASLLVPDKVLVSMKNIHAYKWIALEESS